MKLFNLPNIITLCNLFCGILACYFLLAFHISMIEFNRTVIIPNAILILLCLSLIFDFLDGLAARLTKQNSEFGIQLDSLADVVSFGLLPGLLMMKMIENHQFKITYLHVYDLWFNPYFFLPFIGLFITLFSALRLAKFNLDTEQKNYFKGLNTPTNTIFIFSLFYLSFEGIGLLNNIIFLIVITIISCFLLISNIPMMSLKLKGTSWGKNKITYIFLIISLIMFILFKMHSVPFIIILYIFISILFRKEIIKD